MSDQHFDVVIVGAGISGIGAAYHLQKHCPRKTYTILEGRGDIGGTWDLFRYPGIRSDSDMFTLGYSFRPWKEAKAIADGPSIMRYLRDTAREFGIDRHFRFQHRVLSASWSSDDSLWTVQAEAGEEKRPVRFTCNFLYLCSGYYDYKSGYTPDFAGVEDFQGRVIHPQRWPQDLDYRDKRVIVIGSGATAVTLVPAMAEQAAQVTMLQRSPTYIASLPAVDRIATLARKILPEKTAHSLIRWKNVLLGMYFYNICRRAPKRARRLLRQRLMTELPSGVDFDTHFNPKYEPWDQRLCLVPDADLFLAMKKGKVAIVTDQIANFTKKGILLQSGRELEADIVVTATGLRLLSCGGIRLSVDGRVVEPGQSLTYKGLMLGNVPNCAVCVGYTNASWTLRADLASKYVTRLLNYMDRQGYKQCVPRSDDPTLEPRPLLTLNSGYIQRGVDQFPKQGSRAPWLLPQNYILDLFAMRFAAINDGTLRFSKGGRRQAPAEPPSFAADSAKAPAVSST